jgi:hypothetical protein
MNMIRTTTTITDTCYVQKIVTHNKYLLQFFVCNNNLIYYHYISLLLLPIVVALLCVEDNVYT